MRSVKEVVIELIVENLGVDRERVTSETNIFEDLGADSLDFVELIMCFEEEFDIDIPDNEIENKKEIGVVSNIITYLEKKTKKT